jgi:endonuclease-3
VAMYTMGAKVLPVDAHVHRVATRLGWTARKRADQCHEELEFVVPPNWRYVFHVGCVLHGRSICRPKQPRCLKCCVNRYCEYFKRTSKDS